MPRHVPRAPAPSRSRRRALLLASLAVGLQAGAQYAAYAVGFHPALGAPLLDASAAAPWPRIAVLLAGLAASLLFLPPLRRLSPLALLGAAVAFALGLGPVYSPLELLVWVPLFLRDEALAGVAGVAAGVAAIATAGSLLAARALAGGAFPLRASGSHGTARWGRARRLRQRRGVLLGWRGRRRLRYDGEGHLLTVAPTGSGKGTGPIISNLLAYPGSVVVTDPKGENYAVTAPHRRRGLGQEVVCFDPFGVVGGAGRFNPLDAIDLARPDAVDHASALAEAVVAPRGRDSATGAFFEAEAKALLAGLVLFVCYAREGAERSLPEVRRLLTAAPEAFEATLEAMAATPACHGLIHRAAARLQQKAERERSGVVSTAQSHTHFLDSPAIAGVMGRSTIAMEELKRRGVSAYLVLPPEHLDAYAPWLRLMIASALAGMVRERAPAAERVLFLLDEFGNLGRLEAAARAVTLLRGYGATVWMFVQNLPQLRALYPDRWEMLLDVDVLQAFGTNDAATADHLSRLAGEGTVYAATQSEAASGGSGRSRPGRQRTFAMAERQRRLLLPDEVRRLGEGEQLLFIKGQLPVRAGRLRYFEDEALKGRAAPKPPARAAPRPLTPRPR